MTEYVTKVKKFAELKDGDEMGLFIQDLTPGPRKYNGERVKAIIAHAPEKLPGGDGDVVYFQSVLGRSYGKPWVMRITRKLDLAAPGRPYS